MPTEIQIAIGAALLLAVFLPLMNASRKNENDDNQYQG